MLSQERKGLRTWIEISRGNIKKNYEVFRSLISSKTKLMAVVKSNAYGHSLVDFSREAEKLGADFLGVDSAVEALALRREGIKTPILVLGYTLPEMIEKAVLADVSFAISSMNQLREFQSLKFESEKPHFAPIGIGASRGKPKIHLKVDTGMHRQGFLPEEGKDVVKILENFRDEIIVEGIFTHFASSKNPAFPAYTIHQVEDFKDWISLLKNAGWNPIAHASATSGAILFPEAHFDMVRIGIGLYGYWPSKETKSYAENRIKLSPAMSWKTIISEIKKLKKGEKLGYDLTEELWRDSVIGICPVGYWHGFPRSLSGIGHLMVKGKRVKVLGRVSMDMIVVDLTDVKDIKEGEEAVILGKSGKEEITADEIGAMADSCSYEIITRTNPLIKRIFI